MNKKEFNQLIKEAVDANFDSPEGIKAMKKIHTDKKKYDEYYRQSFEYGWSDAEHGLLRNQNPFIIAGPPPSKGSTGEASIEGWYAGWDEFHKENLTEIREEGDTHNGMNNMKDLHDQIEYQKALAEGIDDARKKVPRDKNPYLGTQSTLSIKGWNDGWDFWNNLKGS